MHDARTLSARWMSACLAGGLLLSAYACGGNKSEGTDEDDGSGGSSGNGGTGGSGGDGSGGSSGEPGTGGSDGGSGGSGGSGGGSTTASGGSNTTGGSSGDGGTGGTVMEIDCTEDADCENADMVCDPLSEVCVGCLFHSDCAADERCAGGECVDAVACESYADCEGVSGAEACDTIAGHCVECMYGSDCPSPADCVNQQCRPYQTCDNSLDCPEGRVCDSSAGRCVRCISDNDCDEAQRCVANTCRRSCSSDNDCTSLGLLCDFSYGTCARCVSDSDCPTEYHCASGRCEIDACEQGSGHCSGNYLYACNASGSGYTGTSCYSNQTCVEGEQASCQDWICTPGATECNAASSAVITCSADGLSIEASTDCTGSDQVCFEATCQDLVCPPNRYFCEGNTINYCYSDGMSFGYTSTCAAGTFCDDSGTEAECVDLLCEPDGPACNGSLATTCNAAGDGYVSGGTDCSDTEEFCVDGECRECNGSVLLLSDSDTTANAAMQAALENADLVVTLVSGGAVSYLGTPAASEFGAIIWAVGTQYSSGMGQAGQDALVAAHTAGTGVVVNDLGGYTVHSSGSNTTLAPLTLLDWSSSTYTTSFTLTASGHPIWAGLPTTISVSSMSVTVGPLINSGTSIATCLNCDTSGYSGAGVAVREGTGGRLVHLAHWGTYSGSIVYNDANLMTMFANAAQWAAGCD